MTKAFLAAAASGSMQNIMVMAMELKLGTSVQGSPLKT